jgi:hypothetical protein
MLAALVLALTLPLAAPAPAAAAPEEPVSPSEFRDYAEGYTLYFEEGGMPFGSEAFEPGGATVWRYNDGTCLHGLWRPYGAQLCFFYGFETDVLCWRVLRDDDGLKVRLLGDGPEAGLELRIVGRDQRPPICGDPGRGT